MLYTARFLQTLLNIKAMYIYFICFLQILLNIQAMYIYFILHLHTYNIYIWFLLLYYKIIKTGNKFKKAKRNLFFCFTKYKYAAYLLNQQRQLTNGRNVCGAIFCEGAIHKVRTLKQANLFIIPSLPCMHFEKKKWRH